jgi:hypothetical protein
MDLSPDSSGATGDPPPVPARRSTTPGVTPLDQQKGRTTMYDMYPEWGSGGPEQDHPENQTGPAPIDRPERPAPQPDES